MSLLLHAGLVATIRQFAAIAILTTALSLSNTHFIQTLTAARQHILGTHALPPIVWAYLLFATGFALSTVRSIHVTAIHMCHAARSQQFVDPRYALKALVAQLGFSTVALAIFALKTPYFILGIGRHYSCESAAMVGWAAVMSMGVACFGASTNSAIKAHHLMMKY